MLGHGSEIAQFEHISLSDSGLSVDDVGRRLWDLIDGLRIVTNEATIVAGTDSVPIVNSAHCYDFLHCLPLIRQWPERARRTLPTSPPTPGACSAEWQFRQTVIKPLRDVVTNLRCGEQLEKGVLWCASTARDTLSRLYISSGEMPQIRQV
jgi:hypothetical protein